MSFKSVVATADNASSSLRSRRLISAVPHFKRCAEKMLSLSVIARNCLGGWFAGFLVLLIGQMASKDSDGFIGILFLGAYSIAVTFIVGFPLCLLACRVTEKKNYRPSLPFGTAVGAFAALVVLILVAMPFYGLESIAVVVGFIFTPMVAAFAVTGSVAGFLTAHEIRSTTRRG